MKNVYITHFRTQDFEEALILGSAGAILGSVDWEYDNKIGTFVFEDALECRKILDKHRHRELWILSPNFLNAYRNIKNELYRKR